MHTHKCTHPPKTRTNTLMSKGLIRIWLQCCYSFPFFFIKIHFLPYLLDPPLWNSEKLSSVQHPLNIIYLHRYEVIHAHKMCFAVRQCCWCLFQSTIFFHSNFICSYAWEGMHIVADITVRWVTDTLVSTCHHRRMLHSKNIAVNSTWIWIGV